MSPDKEAFALLADMVQCKNCAKYGENMFKNSKSKHTLKSCHCLIGTPRFPKENIYRDCKYFVTIHSLL